VDATWLFLVLLRASLFSLGGQTGVPLLNSDLVLGGVMTNDQLVRALTIGRLGTGPGGLYIVAIGYIVLGWLGAFLALVAAILPPLLVLPLAGYLRPRLERPRINGLMRGLALTSSGLVASTSIQLLAGSSTSVPGWQVALVAIGTLAVLWGRVHPIAIIGVGAGVGVILQG
jgi:chromate transporter